jgi:hypothetical protein
VVVLHRQLVFRRRRRRSVAGYDDPDCAISTYLAPRDTTTHSPRPWCVPNHLTVSLKVGGRRRWASIVALSVASRTVFLLGSWRPPQSVATARPRPVHSAMLASQTPFPSNIARPRADELSASPRSYRGCAFGRFHRWPAIRDALAERSPFPSRRTACAPSAAERAPRCGGAPVAAIRHEEVASTGVV